MVDEMVITYVSHHLISSTISLSTISQVTIDNSRQAVYGYDQVRDGRLWDRYDHNMVDYETDNWS